jgi:hypothetical protein
MATITFKTTISDADLQAIANTHGYSETITTTVDGKEETTTNPQTFQEFAVNYLGSKCLLVCEHEITYPSTNDLSPKDFATLKESTLTTLKENSTITF